MIDRVLVADDDFLVRQAVAETVKRHGIDVVCASCGEEAIKRLQSEDFQMAFVDLKMGKVSGLDVLNETRSLTVNTLFVIMTAYGTVETAVEAMRSGAFDFIIKPFSPDQADILIEKAGKWCQMNECNLYFNKELSASNGQLKRVVGSSDQLGDIMRLVERVAPTRASVLLTGESGTGKELIACEINKLSNPEGNRPYIRMNCAAVPENLLESELFGHEKGAFTGATGRRIGRFELANGGTLLLDEIGEINIAMQAKLLRVLQESEFERVGGTKTIKVDVRIIATTNRDLKAEVAAGNFREDLYYRLNVFPIRLPSLRDRGDDVIEIAKEFLERQAKQLRRPLEFSREALRYLSNYSWPGNIREMENMIERIAILEDGPDIEWDRLPREIVNCERGPSAAGNGSAVYEDLFNIREIERLAIIRALKRTRGRRSEAAGLLGFSVRTLRNKLHEYERDGMAVDEESVAELACGG